MLTKEECENKLKNLKTLQDEVNKNGLVNATANIAFSNAIECFEYLIKEHFSNPPLKFEEIKENDFIFDKKTKERAKVRETRNTDGKKYIIFFQGYRCWDFYIKKYEPNRFYRKEVKDVD